MASLGDPIGWLLGSYGSNPYGAALCLRRGGVV